MNSFERCLSVLRDAEVEFVIIGGVAGSAHGSPSVTYDLDICYERSPANLHRLSKALAPYHPRLRGAPEGVPFRFDAPTLKHGLNFTLTTDLGDLDLFGEVAGIGKYADARALSVALRVFGRSCRVLSLEALIRSKRASGRAKDLMVLPELEAMGEIIPRAQGQAGSHAVHGRRRKQHKKTGNAKVPL